MNSQKQLFEIGIKCWREGGERTNSLTPLKSQLNDGKEYYKPKTENYNGIRSQEQNQVHRQITGAQSWIIYIGLETGVWEIKLGIPAAQLLQSSLPIITVVLPMHNHASKSKSHFNLNAFSTTTSSGAPLLIVLEHEKPDPLQLTSTTKRKPWFRFTPRRSFQKLYTPEIFELAQIKDKN